MPEPNAHADWITPEWPAPDWVKACSTTRAHGYSLAPYHSLNLGTHVGDNPLHVEQNRQALIKALSLPHPPCWLNQVHSNHVIRLNTTSHTTTHTADASVTSDTHVICAVMTADCLPILLCDTAGEHVAALHAGWRGLLSGIINTTVNALNLPGERLMAWLGPAIGPSAFGINAEIRQQFIDMNPRFSSAFHQQNGQWHGDLYALARIQLHQHGIKAIFGGEYCTQSEPDRFFSYRAAADHQTGRMASLIWIASH